MRERKSLSLGGAHALLKSSDGGRRNRILLAEQKVLGSDRHPAVRNRAPPHRSHERIAAILADDVAHVAIDQSIAGAVYLPTLPAHARRYLEPGTDSLAISLGPLGHLRAR